LHIGQQPAPLLLAQLVEHLGRPPVQARPLGMALGALVEADEHIPFRLGHGMVSWILGVPSRLKSPDGTPRPPGFPSPLKPYPAPLRRRGPHPGIRRPPAPAARPGRAVRRAPGG